MPITQGNTNLRSARFRRSASRGAAAEGVHHVVSSLLAAERAALDDDLVDGVGAREAAAAGEGVEDVVLAGWQVEGVAGASTSPARAAAEAEQEPVVRAPVRPPPPPPPPASVAESWRITRTWYSRRRCKVTMIRSRPSLMIALSTV